MVKWQSLLLICLATMTMPISAFDGPDPDEGGIGGTGNIDEPTTQRPEIIERPERPERIEHIERPNADNARENLFDSVEATGSPEIDTRE